MSPSSFGSCRRCSDWLAPAPSSAPSWVEIASVDTTDVRVEASATSPLPAVIEAVEATLMEVVMPMVATARVAPFAPASVEPSAFVATFSSDTAPSVTAPEVAVMALAPSTMMALSP